MNKTGFLIEKTIKLYESNTGWGDSGDWTNQDFVVLSEKIRQGTGVSISHVTLKRIWGKVKYESLPSTHTLNTLVQYLGYESWRSFRSQNGNGMPYAMNTTGKLREDSILNSKPIRQTRDWILKSIWFTAMLAVLALLMVLW